MNRIGFHRKGAIGSIILILVISASAWLKVAESATPAAGSVIAWDSLDSSATSASDSETYPDPIPFDLGIPVSPLHPYNRLVVSHVSILRASPGSRLVKEAAYWSQSWYGGVGWPPNNSPTGPLRKYWPPQWLGHKYSMKRLEGLSVRAGQVDTLVLEYSVLKQRPALYRWDDATVTGTAFKSINGRQVSVPFQQTIPVHWGYCVGPSKLCTRLRTQEWIDSPA